jgi:hypothetical protein
MFVKIVSSIVALVMLLGTTGVQPVYASSEAKPAMPFLVRVSFAAGATSAVVDGELATRTWQDFVIRGTAGYTLLVSLTANNMDTSFKVYRRYYRAPLWGRGDGKTTWQRALPASGDYIIRVSGPISTVFSLNAVIPAIIRFKRGTYGSTVTGHTSDNRINSYMAWGRAGQILTATLLSPTDVGITVYGLTDGVPMARAVSGAVTWNGKLPYSQYYVIDVVPSISTTVNYTLGVEIR